MLGGQVVCIHNTTSIALKLQTWTQIPQRIQVSGSIVCGCLRSPVIALTGQLRAQTVQPVQTSSDNFKTDQRFANFCRALFVIDVGFIFIAEMF